MCLYIGIVASMKEKNGNGTFGESIGGIGIGHLKARKQPAKQTDPHKKQFYPLDMEPFVRYIPKLLLH